MRWPSLWWLPVVCAAVLGPSSAQADRETAQHFGQRGDKALQAKTWPLAEQMYRRSLEEDATFLSSRYGLAQALLQLGQRDAGVQELRRYCDEVGALTPIPQAWVLTLTKARKQLTEVDALGTEWQALLTEHCNALLALAGRWKGKDPEVALRCLREAVALRPGDAHLEEQLQALDLAVGPKAQPLFNGKDLSGWTMMSGDVWMVKTGELIGTVRARAYIGHTEVVVKGDFDLRAEMKLLETFGRTPMFALLGTMKEEYVKVAFGVLNESVVVDEYSARTDRAEKFRSAFADLKPPLDPKAWNTYELRYRSDQIHALVNGQEVQAWPRGEKRDSGFVGLQIQDCQVAVRRVEYVQR